MNQTQLDSLRGELEGLRDRITTLLATLPTHAPRLPNMRQYALQRGISMARLRAYLACGCPHRRQGKAILIDPQKAGPWIEANAEHPTVRAAERAALDAARGHKHKKQPRQ